MYSFAYKSATAASVACAEMLLMKPAYLQCIKNLSVHLNAQLFETL